MGMPLSAACAHEDSTRMRNAGAQTHGDLRRAGEDTRDRLGNAGGGRLADHADHAVFPGCARWRGIDHVDRPRRALHGEARGRVDRQAGADDNQDVGAPEDAAGGGVVANGLPEKHDVRPELPTAVGCPAAKAKIAGAIIERVRIVRSATLRDLAVKVNDARAAGALVQVIDVLRDDDDTNARGQRFDACQASPGRGVDQAGRTQRPRRRVRLSRLRFWSVEPLRNGQSASAVTWAGERRRFSERRWIASTCAAWVDMHEAPDEVLRLRPCTPT